MDGHEKQRINHFLCAYLRHVDFIGFLLLLIDVDPLIPSLALYHALVF
jgi:hypothetical protein